jgi:membrane protease YdiL (CAAX protease family)
MPATVSVPCGFVPFSRARIWLAPPPPRIGPVLDTPAQRRGVRVELLIVFTVTLGLAGLRSLISLLDSLVAPQPLNRQTVAINAPQARNDLLDLAAQLTDVLMLLAWGALGCYLLWQAGIRLAVVGLDRTRTGRDIATGLGLTALIGIPGLALYFAARALGANLNVAPSTLDSSWWLVPVLILQAIGNAWAEETLVVGYLITRLRQLGFLENRSLLLAAALRGSYHLYQGFGGFVGNFLMGLILGRIWQRTGRLWPLIVAHTLLDVISFVGYALVAPHVSWL